MSTAADAKVILAYLMEHCGIAGGEGMSPGAGAGTEGDTGTGESRESSLFSRIGGLEDAEKKSSPSSQKSSHLPRGAPSDGSWMAASRRRTGTGSKR